MLAIGDYDVFLCKRNQYGYYVWAKQLDVTGINKNRPMVITPDQGIILTGWFSGTVDFDPGPGIVSLTSAGGEDIFILKLNSAGNLVWVKQMGGTSNDKGSSITLDDNGNIYIVGGFSGLADFNPGTGVYNMIANDHDIFITRLDNQGSFVWAAQLDGSGLSNNFAPYSYENLSLTIDEFENIYIMGPFSGTVDFDPGPNQISLTSIGT